MKETNPKNKEKMMVKVINIPPKIRITRLPRSEKIPEERLADLVGLEFPVYMKKPSLISPTRKVLLFEFAVEKGIFLRILKRKRPATALWFREWFKENSHLLTEPYYIIFREDECEPCGFGASGQ